MPWGFCLEGGLGQRRCHHQMRFGVTSASWPWIPICAVVPCFFPAFFLHGFIHAQVENPLDTPCHQTKSCKITPSKIIPGTQPRNTVLNTSHSQSANKNKRSLCAERSLCVEKPVLLVCSTNSKPMTSREMNSNATQPKLIQLIYIISASRRGWSSYYSLKLQVTGCRHIVACLGEFAKICFITDGWSKSTGL